MIPNNINKCLNKPKTTHKDIREPDLSGITEEEISEILQGGTQFCKGKGGAPKALDGALHNKLSTAPPVHINSPELTVLSINTNGLRTVLLETQITQVSKSKKTKVFCYTKSAKNTKQTFLPGKKAMSTHYLPTLNGSNVEPIGVS